MKKTKINILSINMQYDKETKTYFTKMFIPEGKTKVEIFDKNRKELFLKLFLFLNCLSENNEEKNV